MATRNFLAVDLGAESGRTVVARFDGQRLELQETHRFPNQPVTVLGTNYWDLFRLWHEINVGIGQSVAQAGAPVSLGVDTWGVDFGLLGPDGTLIGNPIQYRDKRTEGMMEAAFQIVPRAEMYQTTGLQFMRFNSVFQLLANARQAQGEPFAGVEKFLFMPDLLNYFFTGAAQAEYTIASTSQMLDARAKKWATGMLDKLGIPTRILPELIETGTQLGPLRAEIVETTGAKQTQVVATAGHDTAAAVAAVPASGDSWCYISSGTWSLMGVELPEPAITEQTLADNFTNEGGIGGTIRFLKNIMGLWLVQECRRSFERSGRSYDYATLTQQAAQAPAFGPVVNPDDDGFIVPDDMPTAIVDYCKRTGQTPPADDGAIVRCCLESLALRYRWVLERMQASTGRTFETIHIVGGGSKNELLCQLAADCCQRPVVTGPVEATALGNVLVQMLASGDVASHAEGRAIIAASSQTQRYEPNPGGQWDEPFEQFCKLLQ